ncbi:hypothetical protein G7Y89_g1583 [Cudoniella acicularis]|uniref:3-beta hydroxysteroid dehydrogenase/isomerase domain-containing protein n=1 Tax=Cudoniella acicularis TaxID=354080 RepID=A0A8H4RWN9_9HELO|nr:hypothetical protein G7Y89_g1583 [Cudoniella acicularis]
MQATTAQRSVLVLGGCGFVGYHLVSHFLKDPEFASVAVVSRHATKGKNHVDGASYHTGDLTNCSSIEKLLLEIRPTVIIHAASPSPVTGTPKEYQLVTIQGTRNLLEIAKASNDVRAFIYVSSCTLAKGSEHINLTEDYPLANTDPKSSAYARTKALAEIMVLEANKPPTASESAAGEKSWMGYLCTASVRIPMFYGTHDPMLVPGCLSALQKGQTNMLVGDGKNMWDACSVENASVAHSLLVRALLDPNRPQGAVKVDGEAFNIHDGSSRLFWDVARTVWSIAGHQPKNERVRFLPSWFALGLASFLEWIFWIFTLGTKRPYNLGKQQVEYMCFTHTYSIEKAQTRLGFKPKQDFEKEFKKAVMWSLEQGGWGKKLKEGGS